MNHRNTENCTAHQSLSARRAATVRPRSSHKYRHTCCGEARGVAVREARGTPGRSAHYIDDSDQGGVGARHYKHLLGLQSSCRRGGVSFTTQRNNKQQTYWLLRT
ncbi:hypothetical protein E2C01_004217 [Portunus trituberculatus]|uniref:Uncharacterized protein n=1 Tax=Portunus trituberculatus TaxID=210409 RepID=A0A5B7CPW9_PORTR|nr:hypothetical protein [Portunus trituberculatus]